MMKLKFIIIYIIGFLLPAAYAQAEEISANEHLNRSNFFVGAGFFSRLEVIGENNSKFTSIGSNFDVHFGWERNHFLETFDNIKFKLGYKNFDTSENNRVFIITCEGFPLRKPPCTQATYHQKVTDLYLSVQPEINITTNWQVYINLSLHHFSSENSILFNTFSDVNGTILTDSRFNQVNNNDLTAGLGVGLGCRFGRHEISIESEVSNLVTISGGEDSIIDQPGKFLFTLQYDYHFSF